MLGYATTACAAVSTSSNAHPKISFQVYGRCSSLFPQLQMRILGVPPARAFLAEQLSSRDIFSGSFWVSLISAFHQFWEFLYYTLGLHPWEMRMVKNNTVFSGHVPKWGQYPVGVFPGCDTKTLRQWELEPGGWDLSPSHKWETPEQQEGSAGLSQPRRSRVEHFHLLRNDTTLTFPCWFLTNRFRHDATRTVWDLVGPSKLGWFNPSKCTPWKRQQARPKGLDFTSLIRGTSPPVLWNGRCIECEAFEWKTFRESTCHMFRVRWFLAVMNRQQFLLGWPRQFFPVSTLAVPPPFIPGILLWTLQTAQGTRMSGMSARRWFSPQQFKASMAWRQPGTCTLKSCKVFKLFIYIYIYIYSVYTCSLSLYIYIYTCIMYICIYTCMMYVATTRHKRHPPPCAVLGSNSLRRAKDLLRCISIPVEIESIAAPPQRKARPRFFCFFLLPFFSHLFLFFGAVFSFFVCVCQIFVGGLFWEDFKGKPKGTSANVCVCGSFCWGPFWGRC